MTMEHLMPLCGCWSGMPIFGHPVRGTMLSVGVEDEMEFGCFPFPGKVLWCDCFGLFASLFFDHFHGHASLGTIDFHQSAHHS